MNGDNLLITCFALILVNMLLSIWLIGVRTAVLNLSWAKIRKLDPAKSTRLRNSATRWLEQIPVLNVIFRLLILTNLSILSILCYIVAGYFLALSHSILVAVLCGAVAAVVFVGLTELIGSGFLASYPWRLLNVSSLFLNLLLAGLCPILQPAIRLQQRFTTLADDQDDIPHATTADEIISLVEKDAQEASQSGTLEAAERQMIRGIFDLDETLVKEIMTPRVDIDGLSVTATISEAKEKIVASGHSRIPVYTERIDNIIGFLYAKDLLDDKNLSDDRSIERLYHQPFIVPEAKNVSDLLDEFKKNKHHIAVVIDEYGGTAGVVTIEDILEEIVGEILDEYDHDEDAPQYVLTDDGALIADARMPIDDVNKVLATTISETGDYDTIGGYISAELGRIPANREVVDLPGIRAQILVADARKITRLKLRKVESLPPQLNHAVTF